jgi:hypothetical protein
LALVDTLVMAYVIGIPIGIVAGAIAGGPRPMGRVKWACLGLIFWPFVVVAVVRRLRGLDADGEPVGGRPPAASPPATPVAVPSEADVADLPEPVTACPRCGFLGVRPPDVSDGVFSGGGELTFYVCRRCNFRGQPVLFRRREEYRTFVRDLNAGAGSAGAL